MLYSLRFKYALSLGEKSILKKPNFTKRLGFFNNLKDYKRIID